MMRHEGGEEKMRINAVVEIDENAIVRQIWNILQRIIRHKIQPRKL